MPHEKVFAVCDNKSLVETMTKEQINEEVDKRQRTVLNGNTEPSNDEGVDGDLYILIE